MALNQWVVSRHLVVMITLLNSQEECRSRRPSTFRHFDVSKIRLLLRIFLNQGLGLFVAQFFCFLQMLKAFLLLSLDAESQS